MSNSDSHQLVQSSSVTVPVGGESGNSSKVAFARIGVLVVGRQLDVIGRFVLVGESRSRFSVAFRLSLLLESLTQPTVLFFEKRSKK